MTNKLITIALSLASLAFSQTAITQTTITQAVNASTLKFFLASVTNVTASGRFGLINTYLYIDSEQLPVESLNGLEVTVKQRGANGTAANAHISGAVVLLGPANAFPSVTSTQINGSGCTSTSYAYTPILDISTGWGWICSTVGNRIVPGFNNPLPARATATVASAAGLITPSGPLFSVSGTAAVTGFNQPAGFTNQGGFCIIPTGNFTWTTANNIGLAGTAVTGRLLCFTYDASAGKFYPSYV